MFSKYHKNSLILNFRAILRKIALLFGLHSLETSIGWYVGNGVVSASTAGRVSALVRQAVSELAPQAINLVDSFGIPEHLLRAPIAHDWRKYNEGDNQGELVQSLL